MNKNKISFAMLAAATLATTAAFPIAASADTVAWWHFDEADPGATAAANTIANETTPDQYAEPWTIGSKSDYSDSRQNEGSHLPVYARPFRSLAVYDPVTDTTRTNRAAMKFTTARGGSSPDSNSGRAWWGGMLLVRDGKTLYSTCTRSITVEAFVCTTGGVFNTFAPIVASVHTTEFTHEKWAIYMEADGTISLRFNDTPYWSENSNTANRGTAKVNDGAWHHVAFTWDGSTIKIFVDYEQDKFVKNGAARQFSNTSTISYEDWSGRDNRTRIGGYPYSDANGSRKFNGLIDEVRVSNVALTPDQFLRMQPLDMDADEVLRVSFDPEAEYGALTVGANLADALGPNRQKAVLQRRNSGGSAAFAAAEKPSDTIAPAFFADGAVNAASLCFTTNGTGADSGYYVQAQALSSRLVGGSSTNFTIECFFKTSGQVRGPTSNRQTIFKLGSGIVLGQATLSADTGNGNGMERGDLMMVYRDKADGKNHYDGTFDSNLDDGAWHHVAFVIDGDRRQERTYVDGRLSQRLTNFDLGVTADVVSLFVGCGFDSGAWRQYQFFDGWIDNLRVTKRALAPEEFLSKNPFGAIGDGPQSLMLADFNGNYDFVCASNASFAVAGRGEARTGGNIPAFIDSAFGTLLLDGTNGSVKVPSVKDISMDRSRVVFPSSPLYELDAYTVEFWAKFTGIVNASGPVASNAHLGDNNNAGILRCTQGDASTFDWYLYRGYWDGNDISLAIRTIRDGLGGGHISYQDFTLNRNVADGKWHHYALTFEPSADITKTHVSLYDDCELVETKEIPAAYVTRAGRVLKLLEGSNDNPNLVGLVNSLRLSRGVLAPSQFLGRDRSGLPFFLIMR